MQLPADTIYLASNSPRRLQLLNLIGIFPTVLNPDFHENIPHNPNADVYAIDIALGKLHSLSEIPERGIVITADTVVQYDTRYLAKPGNQEEAMEMLRTLSGKWHSVVTGCALKNLKNGKVITISEHTRVHFRPLIDQEIGEYVDSGMCYDKAGGYGIQDAYGARFVDRIEGDYYNVMGLPISSLYTSLVRIARD